MFQKTIIATNTEFNTTIRNTGLIRFQVRVYFLLNEDQEINKNTHCNDILSVLKNTVQKIYKIE